MERPSTVITPSEPVIAAPSQRPRARHRGVLPLLATLRPAQWIKNVLIFVPVLLDHRAFDAPVVSSATLAFLAFSLAASAGYVTNDVLDIEADRAHPHKRYRPFAAGTLPLGVGVGLVPVLLLAAFAISLFALPLEFTALLVGYTALTVGYSVHLKRIPVLDVLLLAGFYTLRVLAGVAATGVRFSTWLLAFSMFLFLSLAFMKRYAELNKRGRRSDEGLERRGYIGADLDWLRSMGGSSGYLAVLVLALYINSDEVKALYSRPDLLWLICPVLLYWISRMWYRTHRGKLHEDPIVATMQDPINYALGAMVAVVLLAAL